MQSWRCVGILVVGQPQQECQTAATTLITAPVSGAPVLNQTRRLRGRTLQRSTTSER
jgi:hypothetical protein